MLVRSHPECVFLLVRKTLFQEPPMAQSGVGGIIVRDRFSSLNTMIRSSPVYSRGKKTNCSMVRTRTPTFSWTTRLMTLIEALCRGFKNRRSEKP